MRFPLLPRSLHPVFLLALLLPAQIQAQEPDNNPVIDESLEVRLTRLEVVVTDKKGRRVKNLKADDFQLSLDKQSVKVDFFEEIGTNASPAQAAQGPNPEQEGINYLVFIEDYWTLRRYRKGLYKRLNQGLETLRPQDRAAVVTYRGNGPELICDWTNDVDTWRDALARAQAQKPGDLLRAMRRRNNPGKYNKGAEIYRTFNAMSTAMKAFSDRPGRRVMLLSAGGWVLKSRNVIGVEFSTYPGNGKPSRILKGLGFLDLIVGTSHALGYTIYPIHLSNPSPGSIDDSKENERVLSLALLAEKTGGKMNKHAFNTKQLTGKILTDTHDYYSLGFYVDLQQLSAFPRVRIRLANSAYRLRYRERISKQTQAMLTEGKGHRVRLRKPEPTPLYVEMGQAEALEKNQQRQPIRLYLPVDQLQFTQENGHYRVALELNIEGDDANGGHIESEVIHVRLVGNGAPTPGGVLTYDASYIMPAGNYQLAITLIDPHGGLLFSYDQADPNRLKEKPVGKPIQQRPDFSDDF